MRNFGNLEIYGAGVQQGGRFSRVLIAGSGKITGELECDSLEMPGAGKIEGGGVTVHGPIEIDGAGKVEGPVRGESLEVNGSFKAEHSCEITGDAEVNGSLKVEGGPFTVGGRTEVCGSLKVEGDLTAGALEVDGAVSVEGDVRAAGLVDVDGVLKVSGQVQAETFQAEGVVTIGGLLNAETVEIVVSGKDEIGSIGGGRVRVESGRGGFSLFSKRPVLRTQLIEADEIELEATECQTVRGSRVHIGSGCAVDRVEYSDTLTTAPDARIGEKVRT